MVVVVVQIQGEPRKRKAKRGVPGRAEGRRGRQTSTVGSLYKQLLDYLRGAWIRGANSGWVADRPRPA